MIEFNYEADFKLTNEIKIANWVESCIEKNDFKVGEINYIFCDDAYLHKLNIEFLQHDTYTDIISFDNTLGTIIGGDIFISIERVADNAATYNSSFDVELQRVMIHGVLHYMGYKDKTTDEKIIMRGKEDQCLMCLNN
ncbi:Endoribonuclease YbeY [Polaribacter huanghezhanensis]|uniref:rRNA maturation RNase YbeY n=1 Tax=Polaribacter huanghezhanensis TaxID=1354726 RepID=UPI0026494D57|nr:rRNA maturation RNase YbeY [Polaribacter huanghezhanensis]WKD85510.1 Endoribonuclease YbeY [Polaribacter huanghezhanensis]